MSAVPVPAAGRIERSERAASAVLPEALGVLAFVVSFRHVRRVLVDNGADDPSSWALTIGVETLAIVALLEKRRRRRINAEAATRGDSRRQKTTWPTCVLLVGVGLTVACNLETAKGGLWGALVALLGPALYLLSFSLVMTRDGHTGEPDRPAPPPPAPAAGVAAATPTAQAPPTVTTVAIEEEEPEEEPGVPRATGTESGTGTARSRSRSGDVGNGARSRSGGGTGRRSRRTAEPAGARSRARSEDSGSRRPTTEELLAAAVEAGAAFGRDGRTTFTRDELREVLGVSATRASGVLAAARSAAAAEARRGRGAISDPTPIRELEPIRDLGPAREPDPVTGWVPAGPELVPVPERSPNGSGPTHD